MQNGGAAAATMSQRLRFSIARDLFDAFPTAREDIAAQPIRAHDMFGRRALIDDIQILSLVRIRRDDIRAK